MSDASDRPAGGLLAFGAHPDDIEFGAGAIIAQETLAGRPAHLVVCSRGEAASNGTPAERTRETRAAARQLGATVEFVDFGGDAHLAATPDNAIVLARLIRQHRPAVVLAPTLVENQHPDHARVGRMVRDAARLARFGGLRELKRVPPHAIGQLFFYALSPDAEPRDALPVLIDVSAAPVQARWIAAMEAHASQMRTRNYVEFQQTRARLCGLRAGVSHALPLFPSDPIVVDSLTSLARGARRF